MATGIVILVFAFYWLLRETDFLTVRLLVGKVKPIIKEFKPDNAILCYGCRNKCHKTERMFGYRIPARSITLYGSTLNFNEQCNVLRAKTIKDLVKLQKSKTKTTYKYSTSGGYGYNQHYGDIDILIDGELAISLNGDNKPGKVRDFMKSQNAKKRVKV